MCPFHVGAHLVAHQHRRPALGQATHDQLVAMLMVPTCLGVGVGVGVRVWGLVRVRVWMMVTGRVRVRVRVRVG